MNASPMIREVDQIVANLLIAERAVCIPGVGSLGVVRRGARRISSRMILPPCRMVEFSSQPAGTSLAAAIAYAAGCDAKQAQDICGRWLAQVRTEDALTIGGVGVLRQKSFEMDAAFDKLLNPQGHEPLKLRGGHGGHWVLWTVAAVAIVCGLGACGWILYDQLNSSASNSAAKQAESRNIPSQTNLGGASAGFGSAVGTSSGKRPVGMSSSDEQGGSAAANAGAESSARSGADTRDTSPNRSSASADAGTDGSALAGGDVMIAAGTVRAAETSADTTADGRSGGVSASGKAASAGHSGSGNSVSVPSSAGVSVPDRSVSGGVAAVRSAAGTSSAGTSDRTVAGRPTSGVSSSASSDDAASDPMQAARFVSGHSYVVQGVYSSLENARRALRELERREPALHGRIYLYGPKYMVSMFSSERSDVSAAFVRAYSDRFPDLWTYRAK